MRALTARHSSSKTHSNMVASTANGLDVEHDPRLQEAQAQLTRLQRALGLKVRIQDKGEAFLYSGNNAVTSTNIQKISIVSSTATSSSRSTPKSQFHTFVRVMQ